MAAPQVAMPRWKAIRSSVTRPFGIRPSNVAACSPRPGGWFAGVAGFVVAGGLVTTALASGWMSVLPGPYLTVAGVVALAVLVVIGAITGLASVVGRPGLGGGALIMLLGNPLSAAASAPELLPQPWGTIGQLLPAGR
jgi:hypothetical protein